MTKIPCVICTAGAVFCTLAVAASGACPVGANGLRTEIALFAYAGDQGAFSQFSHVVSIKLGRLSDALNGPGLPDISGLHLTDPMRDTIASRKDEDEYAKANTYLALWRGDVEHQPDVNIAVSNVYLGRFRGPLQGPEVTLSMPIAANNAASTLDTHSMVTLYALAMNAQDAHCPPYVIKAFLDQAHASYLNLIRRHQVDNDVKQLGQAIEAADRKQALVHP